MNIFTPSPQSPKERAYQVALEEMRRRSALLAGPSVLQRLARLPRPTRAKIREQFTAEELAAGVYAWAAWARAKQKPPAEILRGARIIFWLMGRGTGKTIGAAQRVRERVDLGAMTIGLFGPTDGDVEIYMLGANERDEGLLNVFPPHQRPRYIKADGVVQFHTGAVGYVHSSEKPEYRGPNLDTAWLDEPAQWRFLEALWRNIELATRKSSGLPIEILVTTTPRPLEFLKELIADPDCVTIHGVTSENPHNDPRWVARMKARLEGTRTGAQELDAEILGDDPDALFYPTVIDATRVDVAPAHLRTVVSVDPAISTEPKNDETGIMVIGIDDITSHVYVLADVSGRHKPEAWGKLVVDAYDEHGCVAVVGERNRGGDLVESNVRAQMREKRGSAAAHAIQYENVIATKGKVIRAEPVSGLHKQGLIHFVGSHFKDCENEITNWNPKIRGPSPNRLDALVWGVYFLANLSGEEKKDYRSGFDGLGAANSILQRSASPTRSTSAQALAALAAAQTANSSRRRPL